MKEKHKMQFKEEIGFIPPAAMLSERFGEEFADRIAEYHHDIWKTEGAIPLKYRYLIALATAIVDRHQKRAVLELRKAIKCGATKEEIYEVFKQQIWMKGTPTLVEIAPLFEMVDKSFKEE